MHPILVCLVFTLYLDNVILAYVIFRFAVQGCRYVHSIICLRLTMGTNKPHFRFGSVDKDALPGLCEVFKSNQRRLNMLLPFSLSCKNLNPAPKDPNRVFRSERGYVYSSIASPLVCVADLSYKMVLVRSIMGKVDQYTQIPNRSFLYPRDIC